MTDFQIHYSKFHAIDYNRGIAEAPEASFDNDAVNGYIQGIIPFLHQKRNNRAFQFSSITTEACTLTNAYTLNDNDRERIALALATRLAKVEQTTNQRYGHLNHLHQGGLVQAVYNTEDQLVILLAKVDYNNFLDKTDYTRRTGLPFERYVLKAFTVTYDVDYASGDIADSPTLSVFDTNAMISKYWWREFLELEELNTDEANTETALKAHLRLLDLRLTKNFKTDYTSLRNRVVSYFKTNANYIHSDAVEVIYKGYHPSAQELFGEKYDSLLQLAIELPNKKGFDQQFAVISDKVKARIGHRIPLGHNMELSLLGEVDDLEHIVKSKDDRGRKYIIIESETGYEYFKRNRVDAPSQ